MQRNERPTPTRKKRCQTYLGIDERLEIMCPNRGGLPPFLDLVLFWVVFFEGMASRGNVCVSSSLIAHGWLQTDPAQESFTCGSECFLLQTRAE